MTRKLIVFIAGIVLSFAVAFAGVRLAWLLVVGDVDASEDKNAIVRWLLVQTFVVIPGMALIVGGFVGWLVPRASWWLGGVCLLPFFAYGYIRAQSRVQLLVSVACLLLSLAAAYLVSRSKQIQSWQEIER